jgi:hypothetical protein
MSWRLVIHFKPTSNFLDDELFCLANRTSACGASLNSGHPDSNPTLDVHV